SVSRRTGTAGRIHDGLGHHCIAARGTADELGARRVETCRGTPSEVVDGLPHEGQAYSEPSSCTTPSWARKKGWNRLSPRRLGNAQPVASDPHLELLGSILPLGDRAPDARPSV